MIHPFIFKVVLISASGALAPGPLTAAAAALGVKKGWRGGFWVALGHATAELPLLTIIAAGLSMIKSETVSALSIAGGLTLALFAILTAKSAFESVESDKSYASPFSAGILLSALNPFFIAWWFAVGALLVAEAASIWGSSGIAVLYLSHVWIDFAWLILLAHLTSMAVFSRKAYRGLLLLLSALVMLFAADFLYFGFTQNHFLF